MALTRTIIDKINSKTEDDPTVARDLKTILNRCEEGRQTKKTIDEILTRIKKNR